MKMSDNSSGRQSNAPPLAKTAAIAGTINARSVPAAMKIQDQPWSRRTSVCIALPVGS